MQDGKLSGRKTKKHFYIEFSNADIAETYDLNENVLVEINKDGRIVSMTVEHAKEQMDVNELYYQLASN